MKGERYYRRMICRSGQFTEMFFAFNVKRCLMFFMLLTSAGLSPASDEQEGEILLFKLPQDYVVYHQSRKGNRTIMDLVPAGENHSDWTEMLTAQIVYGGVENSPRAYAQLSIGLLPAVCSNGAAELIKTGKENKYKFALWIQACPVIEETGLPEQKLTKVIEGQDSFYVIEKTWRYAPEVEEYEKWSAYLRHVMVCDKRSEKRACPDGL